jgi:hypothetical protein
LARKSFSPQLFSDLQREKNRTKVKSCVHLERGEILVGPGLLLFNSLLAAVQELIHGLVVVHDVVRRLSLVVDLLFLITCLILTPRQLPEIVTTSVADPGQPNFFNPGCRIQGQKDSGSRIRIKVFKFFNPKYCFTVESARKYDPGCSFIPDREPGIGS